MRLATLERGKEKFIGAVEAQAQAETLHRIMEGAERQRKRKNKLGKPKVCEFERTAAPCTVSASGCFRAASDKQPVCRSVRGPSI